MKILLISKIPPYFLLKKTANQTFPPLQTQTFWLSALRQLGHSPSVFLYSKSVILPDKLSARLSIFLQNNLSHLYPKWQNATNRLYRYNPFNLVRSIQLNKQINNTNPKAIIISGGINGILAFPLKQAKNQGIKIIMLNGESPKLSATKFEREHASMFDHIVVNDYSHVSQWQELGAKKVTALPYAAIDPDIHQDFKQKRNIPLLFVGTLLADRQALLTKLVSQNPQIYGFIPPDIGLDERLKPFYHGEAWDQKMISLLNMAKIALNFSPPHMPYGGNLRLFEIPGCGALQITDHCPQEWFADDKEIVLFKGPEDLSQKINYYLSHESERIKIAHAGHIRAHKEYTYYQRFKSILS